MATVLTAGLSAAALAGFQERQLPTPDTEIIVTAIRDRKDAIKDFVGALTAATTDRQLSRFDAREACPAAFGLPPLQKKAVVARMREVAQAAGVPLARPTCRPNVLVIVASDKKALLRNFSQSGRIYFAGMSRDEIRRLTEDLSAAAAWQLAGPAVSADGREMPRDRDTGASVNQTFVKGSRISMAARPQFAAAAVVVDAKALAGLTTTQLADYAAMRTFAQTDPARLAGSAAPTILTALDAASDSYVPVTMTSWDFEFLRALYASTVNLSAPLQRSEIVKKLERKLGDKP